MHPLKSYLQQFSPQRKREFAEKCGTSFEQIKHIYSNRRPCNPTLAIEIDKHSGGVVRCDDLCPKTDFNYLRQQNKTPQR